jgi:hypothetical protein
MLSFGSELHQISFDSLSRLIAIYLKPAFFRSSICRDHSVHGEVVITIAVGGKIAANSRVFVSILQ